MIITKIFRFENSHAVRNCTSDRCKNSYHGHSYVVEISFEGSKLDNAGMLLDFGLMKGTIKEFVDSFDHCHTICSFDHPECVEFFKKYNKRWIEVPFNPSAECLSIFIFKYVQYILEHTKFKNNEGTMAVYSVKVHETVTGSATCFKADVDQIWNNKWNNKIKFSDGVVEDWSDNLKNIIFEHRAVDNPNISQQIYIPGFNC